MSNKTKVSKNISWVCAEHGQVQVRFKNQRMTLAPECFSSAIHDLAKCVAQKMLYMYEYKCHTTSTYLNQNKVVTEPDDDSTSVFSGIHV